MGGWLYGLFWVVVLASVVISVWSMVYARKAKRYYLTAAADMERAARNYDRAAETLLTVARTKPVQEPPH